MQRACQMLSWEEFSIKEIAAAVGYPNALNFSTEFKRIAGYPPSLFRRQGNANMQQFDLLPVHSVPEENEMI
jgi:AraC-like DNA-binding protein